MQHSKNYNIETEKFNSRLASEMQHWVRAVCKCTYANEFVINKETQTFSFKKGYKIKGKQIKQENIMTGNYTYKDNGLNEFDEPMTLVTVTVNM